MSIGSEMNNDVGEKVSDLTKSKKCDIKLAAAPSDLLSKEGFALYIGKTPRAVAEMAKAGKLPAFYMTDPLKPGGHAELWINRREWDKYAAQLVDEAPTEWHTGKIALVTANQDMAVRLKVERMNEPRCIAQLLRNESPRAIDFTITHGKGRKGIIIRTKKQSPLKKALTFLKSRRVWK